MAAHTHGALCDSQASCFELLTTIITVQLSHSAAYRESIDRICARLARHFISLADGLLASDKQT